MGFAQGVSGLNASASNLDVIGNNIANSGTVGFKSGTAQFSDVYAGSRVGLGTQVSGVSQNFTSGAVQTSSRALDVAIVNGDGFFRLASPGGEVAYSRNGQFNMDKDGFIVNSTGLQLTGYPVGANGSVAGGSPAPLQLPTTAMQPNPTQNIAAQFNLDSRSLTPTATPFDAANSTTYNYANAVTVFDSLGNSHELSTFFVKTASNSWEAYATADGKPLASGGALATVPPAAPVAGPQGALTFDTNGNLTSAPSIAFTGLNFGNGSGPMAFAVNVTGTTQFGNVNDVKKLTQDGFTSGTLTSFAINQDGTVTGKYSNEQAKALGQIVLSSFVNPNGLQPKGDNVWAETSASGQPLTGTPGAGTKMGALTSGALEASNVDLTSELVNLIIAQRTYQANAQTVKTQDQVMQTLVNMR
ncbi:MAG: flagellar hook protein FlgE [Polaromonas sp. 39-63-203]|jgi:flagellar hook protein FlgE|uniref:flagellar hook protein FlgE n=1 Tax=Polaromonas sp. TaxID=1869339 RepID=UPI000BC55A9B|nr:flagellar hook protein FlgE [Polaromonas sp.]OYY53578.1 MAG: flagellar hook protein FlgE [Polaromonas sp. 35-63-240]OYZ03239.1 MAG: flagellar hook protein FlgE [Polaromonas sp. 28-63-22]OYZ85008.1 MAG: flagellar hook protein FlgE [Polaromonas sp. 24-62-144]OZB02354.1 MAG: flagellar hook protein FlgE [Polaromonas sp. 39-63-203]HQS32632.1 flagellar hook protein FlgE [Polaromonas sp.]